MRNWFVKLVQRVGIAVAMMIATVLGVLGQVFATDNVTITDMFDASSAVSSAATKIGVIVAAVVGIGIAIWLGFLLFKFLKRGVGR